MKSLYLSMHIGNEHSAQKALILLATFQSPLNADMITSNDNKPVYLYLILYIYIIGNLRCFWLNGSPVNEGKRFSDLFTSSDFPLHDSDLRNDLQRPQ